MPDLLRKGRLAPAAKDAVKFTSSALDDVKILKQIVDINKAHMLMLAEKDIVNREAAQKILKALFDTNSKIKLSPEIDDAHMAVEEQVVKAVGAEVGGNLNLAKSRNDQVSTAIRMKLRQELLCLVETLNELQKTLIQQAEQHLKTIVPGYTHLQPAQPITLAHYLVAQFDALQRSLERLEETYERVNRCPMGAGALATTSFTISRERVAELLGFSMVLENSLDAVSTRDYLLEMLADLSILAADVTRFVEDLILWSTADFGVLELPDEYAFTSSIMPQKKNPDMLEVIRARMSLVSGNYIACATTIMALPSGYNMDFQELTPKLWTSFDTSIGCLAMLSKVVAKIKVKSNHADKPVWSFMAATELANMLVRNHNIPFRTAHKIVGALVKALIDEGKTLKDATPALLSDVSKETLDQPLKVNKEEVAAATNLLNVVESHKVKGGPSPAEVARMLGKRKKEMDASKGWVSQKKNGLTKAEEMLESSVRVVLGLK
jgi:argininosuccinate lyase